MTTEKTTRLEQIGVSRIRTIYEEGYSWVEIPDELWSTAVFTTYINGMDID